MRRAGLVTNLVQPLRRKLPLLIAALLCAVIAAFAWLAQRELGRALDATAEERLHAAASRLGVLLSESASRAEDELRRVASDSDVVGLAGHPSSAHVERAAERLQRQRGSPAQPASRAVFSRECRLLLTVGPVPGDEMRAACAQFGSRVDRIQGETGPRVLVQPFEARGDGIAYRVVAAIVGVPGDTLGFVVQTRIPSGRESAESLGSLIGNGASFLVGNTGSALWTDLSRRVDGPANLTSMGALQAFTPGDRPPQIGVALPVPSTPWVVWVQMPAASVVAPKARTLRSIAIIAVVCVLLGALGAWKVSSHVTAPLIEVTRAAEDLAAGDYSRRVATHRQDELGRLAMSFNRMAAQVEQSTEELRVQSETLEEQVREAQTLAQDLDLVNREMMQAARDAKTARDDRTIAESLLTEVLTRSPIGIAVFDHDLRYVRLNQALADLHGAPIEAHLGRRPRDVIPGVAETKEPILARVLETGETVAGLQLSGTLAGGIKRYWLGSFFPIRSTEGAITGVGALMLDTTAQRELEAQFLQAQKMEAVGRLAGGVAHDFNNLLTVISSYADLLAEDLAPADRRLEDVGEIRRAADRASGLTRQLLAFSRKQVLQPATVSLNTIVGGVEKMLGRLISEDVQLVTVNATDLGMVNADAGQIEQVIVNLVVNARDAMPNGGRITIETANVELSEADAGRRIAVPAGEYVMLAVSDTGHGMGPEVLARLFEPFFTTKPQGQGTGLGLSTVFGIVRQSGGDVWVYSEVGQGTTFKVYLPRMSAGPIAAATESTSAATATATATILLVEDDEALRMLAKRVLTKHGYTVIEAGNGREALELCASYAGRIELVLSDVVMPELGGRELAERIAVSRPRARVIFMSGYTDDDVIRRALIDHRTEFLQKPFTPQALLQRVRQVLEPRARDAA